MKTKHIESLDLKGIQPDGTFEGILSPYNIVDQGGDLIEPGAYSKTIRDQGGRVPLLWQHMSDQPLGTLELIDTPSALRVKGQILLDIPMGKSAYSLIKTSTVRGLSVGYQTIRETVKDGTRILKELKLFEGSIVTFPMATDAIITSVKASGEGYDAFVLDFSRALAEFKSGVLGSLTINTSTKGRH